MFTNVLYFIWTNKLTWLFIFLSWISFNRQMTSICFVCNLPIMSHQVGLVWQGGNGWDEMVREQVIFLQYLIDIARSEHGRARFGETRHFFCKLKRKRKTIWCKRQEKLIFFAWKSDRISSHWITFPFFNAECKWCFTFIRHLLFYIQVRQVFSFVACFAVGVCVLLYKDKYESGSFCTIMLKRFCWHRANIYFYSIELNWIVGRVHNQTAAWRAQRFGCTNISCFAS